MEICDLTERGVLDAEIQQKKDYEDTERRWPFNAKERGLVWTLLTPLRGNPSLSDTFILDFWPLGWCDDTFLLWRAPNSNTFISTALENPSKASTCLPLVFKRLLHGGVSVWLSWLSS